MDTETNSDSSIHSIYINLAQKQLPQPYPGGWALPSLQRSGGDTASGWQSKQSAGCLWVTCRAGVWITHSGWCTYFTDASSRASGVPRSFKDSEAWQSQAQLGLSYLILPKGMVLWKCENTLASNINRCIVTETHFKYQRGFILLTHI